MKAICIREKENEMAGGFALTKGKMYNIDINPSDPFKTVLVINNYGILGNYWMDRFKVLDL